MTATQRAPRRSFTLRRLAAGCLALLVSLAATASATAQLPQNRLNAVSPPGGRVGATFDLKVSSGDDADDLTALVFNHPGIKAAAKTQKADGKDVPVANTFTVSIAADAPAGLYEVRAAGKFGLSNPRTFVVGRLEEVAEKEPNDATEQAQPVELNRTINGEFGGRADVDCFRFKGKKGQHVVVDCRAQRIDSRAEPAVELYDPNGRLEAFNRGNVRNDPVVSAELKTDGEYLVKVYDFTYRNGPDYFYRLSVHTGPHIDFVLPASGVPGTTGKFTLYGRNLPGGKPCPQKIDGQPLQTLDVEIPVPKGPVLQAGENLPPREAGVDAFSYVLKGDNGESNPAVIHLAETPGVVLETEPNDDPQKPQKIAAPVEVCGQFQQPGDVDHFTFEAKAKEVFYIEVFSQRLGTTADPYMKVEHLKRDKDGKVQPKRMETSDGVNDNLATTTFTTSTDDPVYRFQAPEDGVYRISLRDRYFESRGDPRLVYRLCVRRPNRDFRAVVLPITPPRQQNQPSAEGTLALRKGENLTANVIVFRRDGFEGDVEVVAEGLPNGVHCKGTVVGKDEGSSYLVFTSDENAPEWSGLIRVVAKARVEDAEKVQAVANAKPALETVQKALPPLRKAVEQAEPPVRKLQQELEQAKAAAEKKPDDKNLANKVAAVQKQLDDAQKKLDAAKQALTNGDKQAAEAKQTLEKAQAERKAAIQTVERDVRPATVVWGPRNQEVAVSRVSQSLGLSVLKESAPIQLSTDVYRVEVNQGRQVLVPLKVARRNGFDNNVNVLFDGVSRQSNIQTANKNIDKGKDSELYRVFVNTNTKPGTYTIYLKGQAQVSYRKNLDKLEEAKTVQSAADKAAKEAADAAKAADQKRDAAVKAAQQAADALKKATSDQQAAKKAADDAQQAVKKATDEATAAAKVLADAQAAAKAATEKVEAAKKAADEKKDDENLKKALDDAQKQLAEAQQKVKTAETGKKQADDKTTAARDAMTKSAAALAAAEKSLAESQGKAKAAEEEKTQAETAAKAAGESSKTAAAAKKSADDRARQAEQVSRPRNVQMNLSSTPIVLEVKELPATLSASVPGGGNLKQGGKLEIKVTVDRKNGFEGPVRLTLPLPPGVEGLSAAEVAVPADQKEGVLTVQAAGNATTGKLENMVVRATMDFDGKAAVDAPINLTVSK